MVRGGRPHDIVDLLFDTCEQFPAIVADRTTSEEILASRILNGGRRPKLHVSRGLRHDLTHIIHSSREGPVLVVPAISDMYVRDERDRVAGQSRAIAGYDAPLPITTEVALLRMAATFRETLRHLSAPLLVHDALAQFPNSALTGFTVFGYPVSAVAPDDGDGERLPTEAEIADHARFLATTDLATLKTMHASVLALSHEPLFLYWDAGLADLGDRPEFREVASRARHNLELLFPSLKRPEPVASDRPPLADPARSGNRTEPPPPGGRVSTPPRAGQLRPHQPLSPGVPPAQPGAFRAGSRPATSASALRGPAPASAATSPQRPADLLRSSAATKPTQSSPKSAESAASSEWPGNGSAPPTGPSKSSSPRSEPEMAKSRLGLRQGLSAAAGATGERAAEPPAVKAATAPGPSSNGHVFPVRPPSKP